LERTANIIVNDLASVPFGYLAQFLYNLLLRRMSKINKMGGSIIVDFKPTLMGRGLIIEAFVTI
jgi:hypothetical protein